MRGCAEPPPRANVSPIVCQMRAVRIHEDGGPEVLRVDDVPVPEPGEGEALVRLRAASLNHLDVWVRKGLPSVPKPRTLGADGAGTVESIGPGATGFSPGDAVTINPGVFCGRCAACLSGDQSLCPTFGVIGEHCNGTHADFVVVPTRNLHPIPDGLGFEQAAAFPLVFVTAYRMLFSRARLQPGEWVMIWGIGGGVASAALELALAAGARVIALSSQAAKLARAKERGAHAVVDSTAEDVASQVRELTGGRGADIVVEHIGDLTWKTSLDAVAKGGRVVTCGASTGGRAPPGCTASSGSRSRCSARRWGRTRSSARCSRSWRPATCGP
jgi:NADPH:quinone reductase-like Zn-dependent oxidoreductase